MRSFRFPRGEWFREGLIRERFGSGLRISVEKAISRRCSGKKDKPRSTLKRTDGVPPFFPRDSRSLPLFFSARF